MNVVEKERRVAKRIELDCPVCIWHESTNRFFNAKSVNISSTGALVKLPLTAPVNLAQPLEMSFKMPDGNKIHSASVVRINRGQSILQGYQFVAVSFV